MTVCTPVRSSLLLGPFDLLDPESPVYLAPGWDRGAPTPTVSEIQSSVLDGAAVVGAASGNRAPVIPFAVRAADRLTLAQLVNQVLSYVNQASWELTFTPAGGFPVVLDCFRAAVTITSAISQEERGVTQALQINCEAVPFGKSQSSVTVQLAGAAVLLDGFDSGAAPTVTLAPYTNPYGVASNGGGSLATALVTSPIWQGSHSLDIAYKNTTGSGEVGVVATAVRTGLSVAITDDMGALHLRARFAGPLAADDLAYNYASDPAAVCWHITIVGTAGTYSGYSKANVPPGNGSWALVPFTLTTPIPAGETITGYTLTSPDLIAFNDVAGSPDYTVSRHLYLDAMTLFPPTSVTLSDDQGALLALNIAGTARAPIALALSKVGGGNFGAWCVHSAPADRPDAQPLIPLGGGTSGVNYTTDPTVRYGGVYSVWVGCGAVGSGTHTWTVTVEQVGLGVTVTTSKTVLAAANGLFALGEITLPIYDYPAESSFGFKVTVTSTVGADVFNDVLLLDTRGQTVIVAGGSGFPYAWLDEPDPATGIGGLWVGNSADRSDAWSALWTAQRAGALLANPGTSTLLVMSPAGALAGTATYSPRWLQEATQ